MAAETPTNNTQNAGGFSWTGPSLMPQLSYGELDASKGAGLGLTIGQMAIGGAQTAANAGFNFAYMKDQKGLQNKQFDLLGKQLDTEEAMATFAGQVSERMQRRGFDYQYKLAQLQYHYADRALDKQLAHDLKIRAMDGVSNDFRPTYETGSPIESIDMLAAG